MPKVKKPKSGNVNRKRGVPLQRQFQDALVRAYDYFNEEKEQNTFKGPLEYPAVRVSNMLQVSENTVQRCVRQRNRGEPFKTPGKIRRKKKLVTGIDGFTQDVVARCIYKNHELGKHITLQKLLVDVKETGEFSGSRSSLYRIVKEMGFRWKKSDNKLTLMETPYITQKRLTFLRSYIRNQDSDKPRTTVFLDETWIYLNGSLAVRTWTQDNNLKTVTKRPQGEGKRFIVLHAGTKFGFVPNCSLLFVSKSATGDYHGEMNGENFKKWVTDQLLPGLRELNEGPYLIVMDNASYHSVQVEKQPTTAWNMKTLSAWLEKHGIATPPKPSKKELLTLALQNRSILKRYVIDELIENDTTVDCQVLRLPPYHCQYNPIELVWSQAKSYYNKNVIGACVEETSRDKRTIQVWKEALSQNYQHTFFSRNGLIFNFLAGVYFISIIVTTAIFPSYRTRYYQEAQEGVYSGPLFLFTYLLVSIPFSFLSVAGAAAITIPLTGQTDYIEWLQLIVVLWACYLLAEQQTIAILMAVKSSFTAAVVSIYIAVMYLLLGSGSLRSYRGISDWLFYVTYATQTRYAGAFLSQQMFGHSRLNGLAYDMRHNCSTAILTQDSRSAASASFACRYADGAAFLHERYGREDEELLLDATLNMGIAMAYPVGLILVNCLLYLIPLPAFVKAKFRE